MVKYFGLEFIMMPRDFLGRLVCRMVKHMIKKITVAMFLFVIILASCGYKIEDNKGNVSGLKPTENEFFAMGTVITQKVYGEGAQKAVKEVSDRIMDIEARMTINSAGGEINRLNELAGKSSAPLSSGTFYVLENAIKYSKMSDGAFDVTIGPLVKAWGVFTENPRVPSDAEISDLLGYVDYRTISMDSKAHSAKLEKPGQIVDLGGIAKGYAGDEALKIYKKYGIESAFINLGGNVVAVGSKPDGSPWKIGVQNPRASNGEYIGIVEVSDKAVVTSGDYERYFEKDNKRYHHILDPKTGYPSQSGLISTTIVAGRAIDADALSTSTFILGLEKGMKLVESIEGVDAIFITDDKKIYVTEGLKDVFKFTDNSKEFEYVEKR